MRQQLPALAVLTGALLALGACASAPPAGTAAAAAANAGTQAQQQALARYTAYAGPPIESFTWLGHFYSWEPLSKDQLVVFTTPSDAYLLKIWPPCDLRFVFNTLGLTTTASTVYARMDSVVVHSDPTGPLRCPIDEIRKVDYQRLRAAQRQQAQPGTPSGEAAAPGQAPPPGQVPPYQPPPGQPPPYQPPPGDAPPPNQSPR